MRVAVQPAVHKDHLVEERLQPAHDARRLYAVPDAEGGVAQGRRDAPRVRVRAPVVHDEHAARRGVHRRHDDARRAQERPQALRVRGLARKVKLLRRAQADLLCDPVEPRAVCAGQGARRPGHKAEHARVNVGRARDARVLHLDRDLCPACAQARPVHLRQGRAADGARVKLGEERVEPGRVYSQFGA